MLSGAGLADVTVRDLAVPLRAASFEDWWARGCAFAGPLAQRLASLADDAVQAVRAHARAAIGVYTTPGSGLEIPGVGLVAGAHRA